MKEGTCSYFIDNKVYEIETGDIVLIPDGVIHKTNYGNTPHTRLLINCSVNYIPTSVTSHIPKLIYLYRNDAALPEIDEIFKKIETEYNSPDEFTREAVKCLVYSLFFVMARNNNKFTNKSSSSMLVEECIKYIKKNFMHPILFNYSLPIVPALVDISDMCVLTDLEAVIVLILTYIRLLKCIMKVGNDCEHHIVCRTIL